MNKLYQDKSWLYQAYWHDKMTVPQIANICNVDKGTISYFMNKYAIGRRKRGDVSILFHKHQHNNWLKEFREINNTEFGREWLNKKYWQEGLNAQDIGLLCNVSQRSILNWMIKFNVKRRTNSEAKSGERHPCWGNNLSDETKKRIGIANKGGHRSTEVKKKMSEIIKKRYLNPAYAERNRNIVKQLWKNPEHIKKMLKANSQKPTSPERRLSEIMPDKIRYVGNRAWWRKLSDGHNHNPDFKVTGQNKVIEIYGDYWHRNDDPNELIDLYKEAGIDCLIFWEHEIYEVPDEVHAKIESFISPGE